METMAKTAATAKPENNVVLGKGGMAVAMGWSAPVYDELIHAGDE